MMQPVLTVAVDMRTVDRVIAFSAAVASVAHDLAACGHTDHARRLAVALDRLDAPIGDDDAAT